MFHRRPLGLDQLSVKTSIALARLAGTEGFARALLVGIVPLVALEALGSKQAVSYVYLAGSLFTLLITLNLGMLERLLQRRRVVTLGGVFLILAVLFIYLQYGPLLALGIGMRSAAASIFSVCMSLYIMDYIGKRELTRNESRRMLYAGIAWSIGPSLGVWIYQYAYAGAVYALSAITAMIMIGYFWRLRLGDNPVIRAARSRPKNPLQSVLRYLGQTRLRIAYGITLSRSCFWVALFVYGPIYVVEAGLSPWFAGLLLSASSGLLFLSPLVRYLADRFGSRQIIIAGLLLTGVSTIALGLLGSARPLGLLFWICGSIGGAALDVLGNIPFMRSVKPRERIEMTTVFSTWREGSELLTPVLASLVLLLTVPFWVFYLLLGVMHIAAAISASYLPRRL
jgi:MFS family permease